MRNILEKAVYNRDEKELGKYLAYDQVNTFDVSHYALIEEALLGQWHSQHEDLVNMIYLNNLIDDRFVQPILDIASKKEVFRWCDDELEPTLRKCIHVMKMINSVKANDAIKKLKSMNNENVESVLEMYK